MMMSAEAPGRTTPYERVFGEERFESSHFPAIREEAEVRAADPGRREEFALLGGVGALLQEIVPDALPPDALQTYLSAAFHAYHFWRSGRRFYAFEPEVVRSLVESPPDLRDWTVTAPAPALYLEVPARLFWAEAVEGEPPEPVEGAFVRLAAGTVDHPILDLLIVFGMWRGRAGFSAVEVTAAADPSAEPRIADPSAEPAGPAPFRSEIPGAERAGLYSLRTPMEAMLLVTRLLWYLDRYPDSVQPVSGGTGAPEGAGEPRDRTRLEHGRVRPVERRAE